MTSDFANVNDLWASVLVETLSRLGVETAVTCPGSRSSPLTFAFARSQNIEAVPVLDERSAGFFALGLARRTGKPVALVCTSGSAVANFFPAVVEASESGAPLIVLTADRPLELRDCSAGQTIDQMKFYGGYARSQAELATPEASLSMLRYLRQTLVRVCSRATSADSGPAHLNVPFRDPLIPVEVDGFVSPLSWEEFDDFFSELEPAVRAVPAEWSLPEEWRNAERGLILIGPNMPFDEEAWTRNVAAFAKGLGWPVLADALNPARFRARAFASLITGYEFILRSETLRNRLRPERVIVVGALPTCKVLREWLTRLDAPMLVLSPRPVDQDATRSKSQHRLVDFETSSFRSEVRAKSSYLKFWLALEKGARRELDSNMLAAQERFEGKLAWSLSRCLPKASALCVSNSMPPRDLEFYLGPNNGRISVYGSRGANGIDGILSTAIGVAHRGKPTFLLTGDLALLHDTNGALISRQFVGSLTILLVNNAGGGIFGMLPVAEFEAVFEKHFATDQKVDFENWARTYGIAYRNLNTWSDLESAVSETCSGIRILELKSDRVSDARRRKELFAAVTAKLEAL